MSGKRAILVPLVLVLLVAPAALWAQATITIYNADDPGVGFNDPTPALPVGGNTGTTLGEQRQIAFMAAANIWGATLTSVPTITIYAYWDALSCNTAGAVLGSAGATEAWRDFDGSVPGRWYGAALANKIAGADLDPGWPPIVAVFNYSLGNPGCLPGTYWYLGLDGNHGAYIDLVTVLEHEFAHGLGFQTFTDGSTGQYFYSYPTIYDDYLLNTATGKYWSQMTDAERVASAVNTGRLVWTGANVLSAVLQVLDPGSPRLTVSAPAGVADSYLVGAASFGPALWSPGVTAEVMPVVDTVGYVGLACSTLSSSNASSVNGRIAVVDRGTCDFTVKARNVQGAGAVGMIVVNNVAGSPPPGLAGEDPYITIPAVQISLADGTLLKAALAKRSRNHSGVFANIGINLAVRAGADTQGRAMMFAPNPLEVGSSVSHWDISAIPNQLMEPAINDDLTHEVTLPRDMTFPLLRDMGW